MSKCVKVTNICMLIFLETLVIKSFFTKSVFVADFFAGVFWNFCKRSTCHFLQPCAISSDQPIDSVSKAIFFKEIC